MLVLKRLTALAVTVVAVLAGGGGGLAGLGQPSPWQIGLQQSATPVMDDIIWFHDFLLWHHHRDHAVRARAAGRS